MRIERIQIAEHVTSIFKGAGFVFFVSYQGMKVKQLHEMRRKLHDAGAGCQVLKNSYITLGMTQTDVKLPSDFSLSGDTAMVFGSGDPVAVAKVLKEIGVTSANVTVKGGVLEGGYLTPAEAVAVADMPSKLQIHAEIVALIQGPASRVVRTLESAQGRVVNILNSYCQQKSDA